MLVPCSITANAICSPRDEVWERVTDATVNFPQPVGVPEQDAGQLHPPQFGATWQTDAAIYSFGGSDSYWSDRISRSNRPEEVTASEDVALQCYGNVEGITNELWKLERSQSTSVAPAWTLVENSNRDENIGSG